MMMAGKAVYPASISGFPHFASSGVGELSDRSDEGRAGGDGDGDGTTGIGRSLNMGRGYPNRVSVQAPLGRRSRLPEGVSRFAPGASETPLRGSPGFLSKETRYQSDGKCSLYLEHESERGENLGTPLPPLKAFVSLSFRSRGTDQPYQ